MIRLALTYGAVGFSSAAAYLGLGQGQEIAAASAIVVALVLMGVRLRIGGLPHRCVITRSPDRSTVRRIGAFILAFCVVSSMVLGGVGPGGGAVGTASAWEMGDPNTCDGMDYLVNIASFGAINSDSCDLFSSEGSELTAHADHYQQGKSLEASNEAFLTSYQNFGTDTRSIAWSKAKLTIVNGLNANNSSSTVKTEANQIVRDYYSRQQIELLKEYGRTMDQAKYANQANESYVSTGGRDVAGFGTANIEVLNGSSVNITLHVSSGGGAVAPVPSGQTSRITHVNGSTWSDVDPQDGTTQDVLYYTAPPESGGSKVMPIDPTTWAQQYSDIESQSDQIESNVGTYVDSVYSEYQAGELNTSDVADPQTLAGQAATDYNDSGYYSYAAVSLASLGYSGSLNTSMHVTTANASYNGTLFYTADDVTRFDVGETYDPANLSGVTYMAAQDGTNGTVVELSEPFTIESATDPKSGDSLQNVTVERYTYDSTNASALGEELDRLSDLREQYEETQSGGGSGFDLGGKTGAIGALLVVIALLAITRD